ncbi:MAG: dipeptidase [Planctomycetaceae bacterium]
MPDSLPEVERYLADHGDRFVAELQDFLRIPSVSADPAYADGMRRGAEFIRDRLAHAGLDAEIIPTAGHPIVYGSWTRAEGAPTVLVYGHYDVQPADPLDLWETPPFEPSVRDGCLYARGATDDKGQLYTHVKSVEAWLHTVAALPVNVKFVIEGEEEVGSRNLDDYLEANRDRLACDVAVISDTSQFAPGMPAITYGLRGITACEVELVGPMKDLHSGVFGGSVVNPVNALARLIAALHDDEGRVLIPGFYDDVIPIDEAEHRRIVDLPFDDAEYLRSLDVDAPFGEAGYATNERRWARPTCDVNGIIGGYTGPGPKTIVPSRASAKISCRLVPNQNPQKIAASLEAYLQSRLPPGARMTFREYHGCRGVLFDTDSPWMTAASAAIERAFGRAPLMIREGGSIPVATTFREILGVDTLLLGWGQNTDNLHSPNEHFRLEDFHRGTHASACLWKELAGQSRPSGERG